MEGPLSPTIKNMCLRAEAGPQNLPTARDRLNAEKIFHHVALSMILYDDKESSSSFLFFFFFVFVLHFPFLLK